MPTLELARAWYTDEDPVHDFSHIQRVYAMAERIGLAEGADMEIVRAAALLHDVEGSATGGENRKAHHHESAAFAERQLQAEGWQPERIAAVQHCIRAHRFRSDGEKPQSLEAKVLFDADKLDVLGAIGAGRTVAFAAIRGMPIYIKPSQQFLDTGVEEPGEPHSSYHEFLFKLVKVRDRMFTPTGLAIAEERLAYLLGFYDRLGAEMEGRL